MVPSSDIFDRFLTRSFAEVEYWIGDERKRESLTTEETETYVYVRDLPALEELLECIRAAEPVALDTEADSLHNYFEKVCLIQLSLGSEHYLVDPLAGLDLSGLL